VIRYTESLEEITAETLDGFFVGWADSRTSEEHMEILRGSDHVVLAIDKRQVVGFATALTDGIQTAFVSLLEVLPSHQDRGIGTQLMRRLFERLEEIPCVDLTCDPELQPFYARFGMIPSVGMMLRHPRLPHEMQTR